MSRADVEACPVATNQCVENECRVKCQMLVPYRSEDHMTDKEMLVKVANALREYMNATTSRTQRLAHTDAVAVMKEYDKHLGQV